MFDWLRTILAWVRPGPPERCVACTLPIEPGCPTYPYARGGRVHASCAYGRFAPRGSGWAVVPDRGQAAERQATYGTLDSGRPFEVRGRE